MKKQEFGPVDDYDSYSDRLVQWALFTVLLAVTLIIIITLYAPQIQEFSEKYLGIH